MSKRGTYLYLDDETIQILKARGENISKLVNEFLSGVITTDLVQKAGTEINELQTELKDKLEFARKQAMDEQFDLTADPLFKYYGEKIKGSWVNNPAKKDKFVNDSSIRLGITGAEFERRAREWLQKRGV